MRIVLLEPLGVAGEKILTLAKKLEDKGHEFVVYNDKPDNEGELIKRAAQADIVILSNLPFSNDAISNAAT